jgi:DNA-directed RNA polymerase omega subunit
MTTAATGGGFTGNQGDEYWPGIFSRFQLVLLAGRRSKQLLKGAQPRIPADPLKRRNTSIALEELKRGLVPFAAQNGNASQTTPARIDSDFGNAEYMNERS